MLSGSDSTRALGATFREEHRDLVEFDQIVAKMRLRLGSWLRVHPSLLARAILANEVISSCLWYYCFFAVPSPRQLQLMDGTVRTCLWNRDSTAPAARGQVSLSRMTSQRSV